MKSPGSVTAKHAQTVARRARRKLLLTGTPMPHGWEDIYAQYRAIAPDVFGTNYAAFQHRYGVFGGFMGKEIVGSQNDAELQQKIYSIAFRVTKEELDADLGLPGHRHIYRKTELSAKARKIYAEIADDFVSQVGGGNVSAANALVKLLRMAQVTSGYIPVDNPDDDTRVWLRIDDGKEKLLQDVLEDLDPTEPVMIVSRFARDLDIIHAVAKRLGRGSLELSGRRKELEQWQTDDGHYPIIAVQEQAGGVGIDLTRANIQIFYSKGFSLGNYDQILARVDRPGQTRKVLHIHLDVEDSIDEYVEELLTSRRDVVEGILSLVKRTRTLGLQEEAIRDALQFAGMA